MIYRLATLALGPVLALQGRRVRREVPKLPEPEGPREGEIGNGAPLRLLIAGDSATAGVGAAHQSDALAGQLAAALAPRFRVRWRLVARTGIDARGLHDWLATQAPQPFDVALISVGVNDVTGGTSPASWRAAHDALAQLLESRFGARRLVYAGIPPMQAFPSLPQPLRWYLGLRAARLNEATREWARTRERSTFVPFDLPHDPALFAADGFHPGPAGHAAWGRSLAARIAPIA